MVVVVVVVVVAVLLLLLLVVVVVAAAAAVVVVTVVVVVVVVRRHTHTLSLSLSLKSGTGRDASLPPWYIDSSLFEKRGDEPIYWLATPYIIRALYRTQIFPVLGVGHGRPSRVTLEIDEHTHHVALAEPSFVRSFVRSTAAAAATTKHI